MKKAILTMALAILPALTRADYQGDFPLAAVIDCKFTTTDATGVPTALGGSPAISVYKDNDAAQSTAGVTLTTPFDSLTGFNNVRIDTSADGTFYSAGSNFAATITTGTIGSTSAIGYVPCSFSLNARSALRPTTAGRTLDVSSTGEGGVDWANVGSPTITVNLSGTTVAAVSGAVGSVTGAVGSVTGNVGGNVAGSVGSLTTNNDKTGYALSGAGVLAVQSGLATTANVAEVAGDVWEALKADHVTPDTFGEAVALNLDMQFSAVDAHVQQVPDLTWSFQTSSGGTEGSFGEFVQVLPDAIWNVTPRTLTAGSAPTATEVADAVWDELTVDHQTAGTTGEALTSGSSLNPTEVANAVWDALAADHDMTGTTGQLLNWIDNIKVKTDTLGAAAVTVSQPVASGGDVNIYIGDAYTVDHSNPLDFTLKNVSDLTGGTVAWVVNDGKNTVLSVTGSVLTSGGVDQIVRFEVTAAQSATLTRVGSGAYRHQIQSVWDDDPAQPKVVGSGAVNTAKRF